MKYWKNIIQTSSNTCFIALFLPHLQRACKESATGRSPVTIRTPYGLGVDEWAEGLDKYAEMFQSLDGADNYDIKR